jgi:hypothetical protein
MEGWKGNQGGNLNVYFRNFGKVIYLHLSTCAIYRPSVAKSSVFFHLYIPGNTE